MPESLSRVAPTAWIPRQSGFELGLGMDARFVSHFYSQRVLDAVGAARRRSISKALGWIRKTAKRSIRKRQKPSQPGQPPHSHVGDLRGRIFYGYDMAEETGVVGPELLHQVDYQLEDGDYVPVRGTVPRVLEAGGDLHVKEVWREALYVDGELRRPAGWRRVDQRRRAGKYAGQPVRMGRYPVEARPFMAPALEKAKQADALAEAFANSVVAG